jgi:hypothetical protein
MEPAAKILAHPLTAVDVVALRDDVFRLVRRQENRHACQILGNPHPTERDAKFAAAAAPFVMVDDLATLAWIFVASVFAGFFAHRIAKHSPLRKLVPDWESWTSGRRFPMGLPLGMTLVGYLVLAAVQ